MLSLCNADFESMLVKFECSAMHMPDGSVQKLVYATLETQQGPDYACVSPLAFSEPCSTSPIIWNSVTQCACHATYACFTGVLACITCTTQFCANVTT